MPHRVFMLDDDPLILQVVRCAMEDAGLEFGETQQASGALEAMRRFSPDLILLDVHMPGGDGFEICRAIGRDPALSKAPVIFLTGRIEVEDRVRGFKAGGVDYVIKPFAIGELLARVRAHLALKSGQDELQQKVRELSLLQRVRQEMLDMILHDLRTPLSTIKVTLSLVRTSGLIKDSRFASVVESAETATDTALFLVNDVLDLSIGKLKVERRAVNLRELIGRLEKLLLPGFRHLGVELSVSASDDAVQADPGLLFRVLLNLASNALKFCPRGKRVELRALREGTNLRLEVSDQGPGVPEADRERIFELYYRADVPQNQGVPGFGIGLTFCRMACVQMGGRIWAENRAEGGSRFVATVPAG